MAMNRRTRRHLQKQGEMNSEGGPVRRDRRAAPTTPPDKQRSSPGDFVREVRAELRRVVWPSREDLVNYSIVVLVFIVILTTVIAGLDYLAGEGVLRLFDVN
jgi:preprotein translocase subunit SecE